MSVVRHGVSFIRKATEHCQARTFRGHVADMDALLVWHETQVREDDETREEAGEAVDGSSNETVPVGRRKRSDLSFCAFILEIFWIRDAGSKMQVGATASSTLGLCHTLLLFWEFVKWTNKNYTKTKNKGEVSYRFYAFSLRITSAVAVCKSKQQDSRRLFYNPSLTNLLALYTGNLHHLGNFLPALMFSVHEFLFKTSA